MLWPYGFVNQEPVSMVPRTLVELEAEKEDYSGTLVLGSL